MTALLEHEDAAQHDEHSALGHSGEDMDPSRQGARVQQHTRRRHLLVPMLLQAGAMMGIAALAYSSAADWFATLQHQQAISGYAESLQGMSDESLEALRQRAHDYNQHLPAGELQDPYGSSGANAAGQAYADYLQQLSVADSNVIAQLAYPSLGISLPIRHGTGSEALEQGVGHLYGSSLPVGGDSTHAVLTSHSGLIRASLFTELAKAEVGDELQISVLRQTLHYKVESIETVLPDDISSLAVVPGQDRVTLITCTPIGINSHRLLVHAVRTDAPATADTSAGSDAQPGFPWWAVIIVVGSSLTAWLIFAPPRRRRHAIAAAVASNPPTATEHGTDTENKTATVGAKNLTTTSEEEEGAPR